jgi:AcrR family transcriptional regulator
VTKWTYEAVQKTLDEYGASAEPSDPKERKRLKLVRAATELFVAQGYRKTSVDDVARRAGVSKGTVYLYFANKGELLLHAIVEAKKRYVVELRPIFDEHATAQERLRRWLRAAFVMGREMPLLARLMNGDMELIAALEDMPSAAVATGQAIGLEFLTELIADAAKPQRLSARQLEDRARVLLGLGYLSPLFGQEKMRGGLSLDSFAEVLADVLMDGLRAPGGEA